MKRFTTALLLCLILVPGIQAQYTGQKYLRLSGGYALNNGCYGSLGVGFTFKGGGRLELPAEYEKLNRTGEAEISQLLFAPTYLFRFLTWGRLSLLVGATGLCGYQWNREVSQTLVIPDRERFFWGGGITPRVELLLSRRLKLLLDYRYGYYVNALQRNNHRAGIGINYLF